VDGEARRDHFRRSVRRSWKTGSEGEGMVLLGGGMGVVRYFGEGRRDIVELCSEIY
jgi:hypothetical protein